MATQLSLLTAVILLASGAESTTTPTNVNQLGCFTFTSIGIELPGRASTVSKCISSCTDLWYGFALLTNGTSCRCSSSILQLSTGDDACTLLCGSPDPCGGPNAYSAYRTGVLVPGPPTNISVTNLTENSVHVWWQKPDAYTSITGYKIHSEIVFTYSSDVLKPLDWIFSNNTYDTRLTNLHSGTVYNLTICAMSSKGAGAETHAEVETIIGEPDPSPPQATVVEKHTDRMVIRIPTATNFNGPVSNYRVVVINEEYQQGFLPDYLKPYYEANREGIPYYITAELDPHEVQHDFTVGDKKIYNGYFNAPLPHSKDIGISIGIVSSKRGVTKVRYANTGDVMILNVTEDEPTPGPVMALGVAVAIGFVLLIIGIGAVIVLRRQVGLNRRQRLTQSMALSGPCIEIENTGFIPDEEERVDHYVNLKRQLWNIPRNFLEVDSTSVIGVGTFGQFVRGRVQHQGMLKPSLVQTINDADLSKSDKKTMLSELDVLIKSNGHENIIALIGICELPETLYVVLEDTRHTLKELLLSSRHRDFQTNKFCLIDENKILQIIVAIAKGMEYLSLKKILHKKLCCRNIVMGDGMTPKISGFGLNHICPNNEKPDYTRWTAQEMFKQNIYLVKSDVWSFGCLLWEILSLGGTLYGRVASKDVPMRVMKGMRSAQLLYVGDELYQMCLHCWQLDLDERPPFSEIHSILESLASNPMPGLLSFLYFNDFNYESYNPELELLN